ncbi:MAG: ribonuclease III family protein [Bdellovibrionota bacterium]
MNNRLEALAQCFSELNYQKLSAVFPQLDCHIDVLSDIQEHKYLNKKIAAVALTHRSALVFWPTNKTGIFSNERLEFLGDAFLSFYIASESMLLQSDLQEGELSRLRAIIVGTENLAQKSRELGLGSCLLVGKSEVNSTPNMQENVLADAFEAVTAALLIDAGEQKAKQWLNKIFKEDLLMSQESLLNFDSKGKVQQWTQSIIGVPPTYKTIGTEGTPKETSFIVGAFVGNTEIARASAKNKREASKKVAEKIIELMETKQLTKEVLLQYVQDKKN